MTLDRLSQITEVGIKSGITLNGINVIGVVTATSLTVNGGAVVNGVVTATSFSGNVTGNITPTGLVVSGVSTFQSSSFWGDGDIAYFGDGQDLLIFHNSTDSIIRDNGTGDLNIEGGNRIRLTNPTGIETYAVFNQDGASELWYDNAKKFETTGAGVSVYGGVSATGLSTFSGGVAVSVGSTSAPSISPSGDSNTGIFFPSADTIAFAEGGVEALRINSSGRVTKPYQPAFFASGNQGIITVAVGSYFPFNTLNTTFANSNRNNGYSTSTYLYTAPVTGLYQFYIQIYLNTASNITSMTWWKNGTQLDYGNDAAINIFMNTNSSTTPSSIMMNGSVILELSANDTIGIKPRTGNGNGISLYTPHSSFWGYLIG